MKTELWAKEVGEFSITLYGQMGCWALRGCHNINEEKFSKR